MIIANGSRPGTGLRAKPRAYYLPLIVSAFDFFLLSKPLCDEQRRHGYSKIKLFGHNQGRVVEGEVWRRVSCCGSEGVGLPNLRFHLTALRFAPRCR